MLVFGAITLLSKTSCLVLSKDLGKKDRCSSQKLCLYTVFCFSQLTKRRKLSKAREAKAMHCSVIDNLLAGPSSSHGSSEDPQLATKDNGIQCG